MTDTITKRLHISGLTPALTSSELFARLSTFGTVKSLDGFGLSDAVGQPRKFAYATLEATPTALKRCFTSLSGTTWKGAKLRIGEAKPDYRARLAEERAKANEEPPRKRQRTHYSKYSAVLSSDMSLVTRENASNRPGWKVMPSGRIVRSMRMRPGKPLPPSSDDLFKKPRASVAPAKPRTNKKVKIPDSRARIRTIDVTKWNGVYLRGSLLDGQIAVPSLMPGKEKDTDIDIDHSEEEDEDKNMEVEGVARLASLHQAVEPDLTLTTASKISQPQRQISASSSPQPVDSATATDFVRERAQNLRLLNTLLGGTEWDGRESDSEIDESGVIEAKGYTGEEEYEIVSVDRAKDLPVETGIPASPPPAKERNTVHTASVQSIPTATKPNVSLKDLFAPREEDAGFSLLNHLDLELDDDDELDMAPFVIPSHNVNSQEGVADGRLQPVDVTPVVPISSKQKQNQRTVIDLDPKMPLFFPPPETFSTTAGPTRTKGHSLILSSSSSPFYQSQTEEQIQQRWEENKLELTRGWKKRWREAVKVKRRRGGGADGDIDS